LIAVILIYASTQPDTFRIQRTAAIQAAPDKIFAYLNDFHTWTAWSPWEKVDPGMKRVYSGTPSGLGTVYEWEGNKKIGQGRMEIIESAKPSRIKLKLDFLKPFEAHNTTLFALEPKNGATEVTWAMEGPSNLMMKVLHLFMNMDKMIGGDFERGLANLKALAEK
jgi:hypothetical protein